MLTSTLESISLQRPQLDGVKALHIWDAEQQMASFAIADAESHTRSTSLKRIPNATEPFFT